jgi:uncharacterized protein
MKKLATAVLSLALITVASSAFAANAVRISQVYGGGGSASAAYLNDYVEIFNSSAVAVDISGWALEYGSATGNWGSSALNQFVFPVGTSIQPCKYILVALSGGGGGAPLPVTPDFVGTLTLSGTSGKVGLFTTLNNNLACGSELAGTLVDKVSYGTGNCPEVTNVPTLSSLTAAIRKVGGMTDTDNNLNDFTVEGSFAPRNSQSPGNPECLVTPTTPQSWGSMKAIYR